MKHTACYSFEFSLWERLVLLFGGRVRVVVRADNIQDVTASIGKTDGDVVARLLLERE